MKNKILALTLLMIIASVPSAFGGFFLDTDFNYGISWSDRGGNSPDGRETLYGGNLGFGYYIHRQFNIKLNLNYTRGEAETPEEIVGGEINIAMGTLAFEFIPRISFLARYRVFLLANINFGALYSDVKVDNQYTDYEAYDWGYFISVNAGFYFQYTQLLAPFFTVGWGRTIYQGEWEETDNDILMLRAGIRFFFFDSRNVDEEF